MSKRPTSLDENIDALFTRKSVTAQNFQKAGYNTLKDLLWIIPKKVTNIPSIKGFSYLEPDSPFKGKGNIISIIKKPCFNKGRFGNLSNIIINVQDTFSSKTINLKWFNVYPSFVSKFQNAQTVEFYGQASSYNNLLQIVNPDIKITSGEQGLTNSDNLLEVLYATVINTGPKQVKKLIRKIPLHLIEELEDPLPDEVISKNLFPSLAQSFLIIHGLCFSTQEDRDKAIERLIYDEFFFEQVQIFKRKSHLKKITGIKVSIPDQHCKEIIDSFPFSLTVDQIKSIKEIQFDFGHSYPMMRLVQGDVGCGKTCVAIAATIMAYKERFQSAIMCPTESLAGQHYIEFSKILSKYNIKTVLLTSSTPKSEKEKILKELKGGAIQVILGTHSLIGKSVEFNNLGLAIIDEQHKFGVNQRIELVNKGNGVNSLILTATPIPRSLRLTQFGDLDISLIKTMPMARKGYKTRIVRPHNLQNFFNFVETRVSMNEQVYIVVPAIFDDISRELFNLEMIYEKFQRIFSQKKIKCLHGKMKASEKSNTFISFKNKKIDILIATSVIEVGIDNHNATVMAIFNPEQFGLSSLHQLRGRVGRGKKPGFCFLIVNNDLSDSSMHRLKILENNDDGFVIAEEDLKNRGEGDLFGVFQSGRDNSKNIADITEHSHILIKARKDCEEYVRKEPLFFQPSDFPLLEKNNNILTTI